MRGVLRAVLLLYRTEQLLYIGADPVKVILLTYEGQKPELLFLSFFTNTRFDSGDIIMHMTIIHYQRFFCAILFLYLLLTCSKFET